MSKPCAVYRCTNNVATPRMYLVRDYEPTCYNLWYECDDHVKNHERWPYMAKFMWKSNNLVDTDEYNWIGSHLNYDSCFVDNTCGRAVAFFLFSCGKVVLMIPGTKVLILYRLGNVDYYRCHDEFVYDDIDKKNKINEYTYVPIWRKVIRASNIYPNILPRDVTGMIELFL